MQGFIYVPKQPVDFPPDDPISSKGYYVVDHWECTSCKCVFYTHNCLTGEFEPPYNHVCKNYKEST